MNKPFTIYPIAPPHITSAVSVFVGYWLLNAWIGNGDRHHENWGFIIQLPSGESSLAPTYDHASCLGRELQDAKRETKLQHRTIAQYASKSLSAFYHQESDRKAIPTFDAFAAIARRYPQSALTWLNKLFFANRLLRPSRPDFSDFVQWLNIPEHKDDPIALLARSGGRRKTDNFEVFPSPEPDEAGKYHVHFFTHGLQYFPDTVQKFVRTLQSGDALKVTHDLQNEFDSRALILLCSLTASWTNDFQPFSGAIYQPLPCENMPTLSSKPHIAKTVAE